ncbi:MAG: hypothetical protein K8I60_10840 [Anaerolineae bacterium]|nr:hypothetical protein [Anaerolineae bacterium]
MGYQADVRTGMICPYRKCCAKSTTSENSPKSAGVVRAIARSLHWPSQMGATLGKGDFDVLTLHVGCQDVFGAGCRIGTAERRRFEFVQWVAHQHPADGQRGLQAGGVPQGSGRIGGKHLQSRLIVEGR